MITAKRSKVTLNPDSSRVCFRPFSLGENGRHTRIVARVMGLSEEEAQAQCERVLASFAGRHTRLKSYFERRFRDVEPYLLTDRPVSEWRRLLLGAYFTHEYALEAAALFNPSIVAHPDQSGVKKGELRFILSLRATGEGHISSITFRTGVVDKEGMPRLDEPTPFVTAAEAEPHPSYDRRLLLKSLRDAGMATPLVRLVFEELEERFTYRELEDTVNRLRGRDRFLGESDLAAAEAALVMARANYIARFSPEQPISERVLFPSSSVERKGIEDARFTRFVDEDGSVRYYATYTAYDGKVAIPQILDTLDFEEFRVSTLNGPQALNKGMALFPRKIGGRYAMVSRQDGENLYLMYSDMLHFWYEKQLLMRPTYEWEFVQIGNCGAPIETEQGWLLLTHGVGAMRQYAIGAALLDLEDPSRVIARTREPILVPVEDEREGYVPNVVYTCGALEHRGKLLMPYAMSDQCTKFVTYDMDDIFAALGR